MSVCTYMMYCEDVWKTNEGGLSSQKRKPKDVCQYTNEQIPAGALCVFIKIVQLAGQTCKCFLLVSVGRITHHHKHQGFFFGAEQLYVFSYA